MIGAIDRAEDVRDPLKTSTVINLTVLATMTTALAMVRDAGRHLRRLSKLASIDMCLVRTISPLP